LCTDSVADAASLPLPALSAKKVLNHMVRTKTLRTNDLSIKAKDRVPFSANSEAILASLKERALRAFNGGLE